MRTLSLDLRERALTSYDQKEGTREEVAVHYQVSSWMVHPPACAYSTVTLLARFRGLSTSQPRATAIW